MAGPCHIGAMRRDDGADDEARAGGRRARPAPLVPVDVTAASETRPAALVVVSPGGYRVEGLDVATVSALLRTLG